MKKIILLITLPILLLCAGLACAEEVAIEAPLNVSDWQVWVPILLVALVPVLRLIVRLTPTPKDDTILASVLRFLVTIKILPPSALL